MRREAESAAIAPARSAGDVAAVAGLLKSAKAGRLESGATCVLTLTGHGLKDTESALGAPEPLWWSGVGDLVAKVTAVADWKLAFHARGEPIDDFAALLSDATVHQFLSQP